MLSDAAALTSLPRILAAARRRFETFGYRRTGIAEIARDAGVASGTLYRYFKGKEEVFLEVSRQVNEEWLATARAALATPGTARERLQRLGQASVAFNRENALLLAILRRDTDIVSPHHLEQMYEDLIERNVALIADVVRVGIAEGTFREVDPERTAFILFSLGNALSMQTRHPYGALMPLFESIVYEGLLPRSPLGRPARGRDRTWPSSKTSTSPRRAAAAPKRSR